MRQVTHALLTRPPLSHSSIRRNQSASFDLHVLSTPPAFILSQDQTLVKSVCFQSRITTSNSFLTLLFLVHLSDVRLNFSLYRNFQVLILVIYCLIINVLLFLLSCDSSFRLSHRLELVNNFFKFFQNRFLLFFHSPLRLSHSGACCQQLFSCF